MFATVKLSLVLVLSVLYLAFGKWGVKLILGIGAAEHAKSWSLYLALVVLTIFRDKFEKKIVSAYDPSKLHFGRAFLTPLIYLSFTVLMIIEQSLGSFLVATLY